MRTAARALGLCCSLFAGVALAQSPEALGLLRRIQDATRNLSYSGTFVYQHGGRSETSRITRYVDASGAIERLEVLDGLPREVVRTRDTVKCFLPQAKLVKIERRTGREFPALLPEQLGSLAGHYDITLGETRRVGGFECRAVVLTPRDDLRFGYRLYADARSGMLMKAVTFDAAGNDIEQFMFTQLTLGRVTRDMVRPRHPATAAWRVEDVGAVPASFPAWALSSELPGFHKVVELKRTLGESRAVSQMVFSDGLAAVSVFIQPMGGRTQEVRTGLASMGAINIYRREVAHHVITVVGEAPPASVQRIADSVEYRPQQ